MYDKFKNFDFAYQHVDLLYSNDQVTCSDTGYLNWRIKIYKIDAVSFSKLMFGSLEIERAILKRLP